MDSNQAAMRKDSSFPYFSLFRRFAWFRYDAPPEFSASTAELERKWRSVDLVVAFTLILLFPPLSLVLTVAADAATHWLFRPAPDDLAFGRSLFMNHGVPAILASIVIVGLMMKSVMPWLFTAEQRRELEHVANARYGVREDRIAMVVGPVLILLIALGFVLALDVSFRLKPDRIEQNGFLGFGTRTLLLRDLKQATDVRSLRAPNGKIVRDPSVRLVFADKTTLDERMMGCYTLTPGEFDRPWGLRDIFAFDNPRHRRNTKEAFLRAAELAGVPVVVEDPL